VPAEDLSKLFFALAQEPKWSQMVELLSFLTADTFNFDEVSHRTLKHSNTAFASAETSSPTSGSPFGT